MRDSADTVIVGAGIMGLSIAYHLAKLGHTNVTVLDKGYLCGGASGRNGGGVRAQWSSEANVRLMRESISMCRDFAGEMKINVWLRQGGYLFLVRSEERRRALEASCKVQNECGLSSRMLTPREARKLVPELDTDGLVAASYNPDDGVVFPWPFVWGFANAAQKLGVEIATFTEVTGFETEGRELRGVRVQRRSPDGGAVVGGAVDERALIRTRRVVNACGAWSPALAAMLGVRLPNKPHRHEICSTEPLKPWLKPLVADLTDGLYFSQSTRGEIVGGIGLERVPEGVDQRSSFAFLGHYARSLVRACPVLGDVKVLRQWAGCYDLTPDQNPIVGYVDDVDGFYQASGFMGHGFMMAPVMGKRIAAHVVTGDSSPLIERWNLRRFAEGRLLSESMIIG
ncbi:MAG: FAD-binding oxidoreductase [Myxococcales bacterium]|nr:FAD-binding oxidoreductase [Myxococcales bacterium]MBL0196567.1 FAD-binding oxidoreductase [Myxococcales bacterium]